MTLLPPNALDLESALEILGGERIGAIDTPLRSLWSAEACPSSLLPYLAWALSIDEWDPAWPEPTRRARVASAIGVQRRKGTLDSVRRVVRSFGGDISIREWWQHSPPTTPHTFSITLALPAEAGAAPSAAFVDAVISEITAAKPLRSHFDFVIAQNARARVGLRGVARCTVYARLALTAPVAGA